MFIGKSHEVARFSLHIISDVGLFPSSSLQSNEPKTARKENGAPVIEDWVSESEGEDEPKFQTGNPQQDLKDKGVIDSGCSRHMTGNKSYLTDYEEIDGGFVAFGGNSKGGKITGKGKIRTSKLDFEDVYFVKELKFNLFSVSQMSDKKNSVLFTDTACVVLSLDFKLTDESHVLLKVPRKDNMYSVDLKNVVPQGGLTCLFAKATPDESNLWHRRLGHVNFKTMNKLTLGGRGGESFWEGGDDFRVDVLPFHTCLTDILGFLEKLEWWFEQDIDKEEERFEKDEDGVEV
ncbi:ribonuclease H-like domain-containing protein [Tanacetum coccineum]